MGSGTSMLSEVEEFDGYPVDACCVLFGIMFMVILENVSRSWLTQLGKRGEDNELEGDHEHEHPVVELHKWQELKPQHTKRHVDHSLVQMLTTSDRRTESEVAEAARVEISSVINTGSCHDDSLGHTHGCVVVNTAANASLASAHAHGALHYQITAYMFELACIIHSVLIGE